MRFAFAVLIIIGILFVIFGLACGIISAPIPLWAKMIMLGIVLFFVSAFFLFLLEDLDVS